MRKGFLYIFFNHTDISSKIQIFLVIYTDFVLDQSGRSAEGCNLTNVGLKVMQFMVHSIPKFHLTNVDLKVM